MVKKTFAATWLTIAAAFLAVEGVAVFDADLGDTFSELVWYARDSHPGVMVGMVLFWVWMGFHFFIQDPRDKQ